MTRWAVLGAVALGLAVAGPALAETIRYQLAPGEHPPVSSSPPSVRPAPPPDPVEVFACYRVPTGDPQLDRSAIAWGLWVYSVRFNPYQPAVGPQAAVVRLTGPGGPSPLSAPIGVPEPGAEGLVVGIVALSALRRGRLPSARAREQRGTTGREVLTTSRPLRF